MSPYKKPLRIVKIHVGSVVDLRIYSFMYLFICAFSLSANIYELIGR